MLQPKPLKKLRNRVEDKPQLIPENCPAWNSQNIEGNVRILT